MDALLQGKHALVTGGARGIGRAITLALARAGAEVITCYRSDDVAAKALSEELADIPGEHEVLRADVSSAAGVGEFVAHARARWDRIDTVVHNAGRITHVPFGELGEADWHDVVDTSLTAGYHLVRGVLPVLVDGSSVTMVGSGAALVGIPLRAHYTAAKAGQIGLVRSLAKELGPQGIRVNVLAPGPTETDEVAGEQVRAMYRARIPLGRLGEPTEIASAAVFLASEMASFVTGATLHADGGI